MSFIHLKLGNKCNILDAHLKRVDLSNTDIYQIRGNDEENIKHFCPNVVHMSTRDDFPIMNMSNEFTIQILNIF